MRISLELIFHVSYGTRINMCLDFRRKSAVNEALRILSAEYWREVYDDVKSALQTNYY